jgi:hypothetical protein
MIGLNCYAEEKKPLFIRLGGKVGVTKIAEVLVDTLSTDSRLLKNAAIQEIIKKNNAVKLKANLSNHICEVTAGPCKAKGPLVVGVPVGFKLGFWEWIYFLQDINSTLDKCNVSKTEKFEIVTLVTQMKSKYASSK